MWRRAVVVHFVFGDKEVEEKGFAIPLGLPVFPRYSGL